MAQQDENQTGERDLAVLLRTLSVSRRDGVFTVCAVDGPIGPGDGVEAVVREAEAITVVVTVEAALRNGWPVGFEAAWLTLDVHSSLEAVGLTAAVAGVLAESEIPCNVVAGYYHDHLLVPVARADEAMERLTALRSNG